MSKASSSLVLKIINGPRFRAIYPLLSTTRNCVSGDNALPFSPLHSTTGRSLHSSARTHCFILKSNPFQSNPSRNLATHAGILRAKEAFESDESTSEELLAAFKVLEPYIDGTEQLGLASLKVGQQFQKEGKDPEKMLYFADKAMKSLYQDGKPSTVVAMALYLMGCGHYSLKRLDDSLVYLNRADSMLGRLEEEGVASVHDIGQGLHTVQLALGNLKFAMGRRDEALDNLKRALEIQEMTLEKDSTKLGVEYRNLAHSYESVSKLKEGLPFGLKALEIHMEELGPNSVEVAHDRRILAAIYTGMGEHMKALEQFKLSHKAFKHFGLSSESLSAEMGAANMQIALGKYDEAIVTLKGILQQTKNEKDSENQAHMFFLIGKALCNQGKFADSKGCLEIACRILDKKETVSPFFVAQSCTDIATIYQNMNESKTAVSLLKRALAFMEKQPQEQHAEGTVSARIGWILLLGGEVAEAIPYLENATERLKESSFASKHFVAGHNYNNLGAAYLETQKPQLAAQMFAIAKDILDVSLGPQHADSIEARQNLSKVHSAMGSYTLAIEFQQQVIDAWEGYGPSAQHELREAKRILEELKRKANGTATNQLPTQASLLPRNSLASPRYSCYPANSTK